MKVLPEVRNICAHDGRLYSISLGKESEIKDTDYHAFLKIPLEKNKYSCGKKDFFAILIIFKGNLKKERVYKTRL